MYYKLLYYIRRVENFDGTKAFDHIYFRCKLTNLN